MTNREKIREGASIAAGLRASTHCRARKADDRTAGPRRRGVVVRPNAAPRSKRWRPVPRRSGPSTPRKTSTPAQWRALSDERIMPFRAIQDDGCNMILRFIDNGIAHRLTPLLVIRSLEYVPPVSETKGARVQRGKPVGFNIEYYC